MNNDELFDDYLDKKLSQKDRNDFNQRIKKDEEFAQSFTEYIEIKLAAQVASELEEPKKTYKPQKRRTLIIVFAIIGILTFMLLLNYRTMKVSELYEEPIALVERGGNNDLYENITTFYEKGDYNNALFYIDEALNEDPENAQLLLYKGICLRDEAFNHQYDDAIRIFQEIENTRQGQIAEYHLGLTYCKKRDTENAKRIFNNILENENHAKYKEAKDIMRYWYFL